MARRAVFDTNVLVSGYLWRGTGRKAIEKVRSGEWILLSSKDTTDELIRVLAYSKFGLTPAEIEPIIQDLLAITQFIEVTSRVSAIKRDPTDDIFLALALDGRADVIVSGDHHLLDLDEFRGIPIISLRRFLTF